MTPSIDEDRKNAKELLDAAHLCNSLTDTERYVVSKVLKGVPLTTIAGHLGLSSIERPRQMYFKARKKFVYEAENDGVRDMSTRAGNAVRNYFDARGDDVKLLKCIQESTEAELIRIPHLGPKSLQDVRRWQKQMEERN